MATSSPGSSEQATGIESELDAILAPVEARLGELQDQREELASQVAVIDEESKRLKAILRAAFPERFHATQQPPKPQPTTKASKKSGATGRGISVDKTDELEQWVRDWLKDNDSVTQTDARLHLGWDQSRVSAGFHALRDRNVLRLAGTSGSRKIYRPTQKVLEELNAA